MRLRKLLVFLLVLTMFINMNIHSVIAAPAEQSVIPIKSFSPSGNNVRPDSPIIINLDTEDPNWQRVRNQFENGNYSVTLNGSEIPSTYDPVTATITADPGLLTRYSEFNIDVLIKSNLQNNSGTTKPSLNIPISFSVGSDIGEPTNGRIIVDNPNPRVTDEVSITVEIFDDYGNLSTIPVNLSILASESGSRLLQSAVIDPSNITSITGSLSFKLSDKEAEIVNIVANVEGEYKQFELMTSINFRPGAPTDFVLSYPNQIAAGTTATLTATVTDLYGNPVEDGETVTVTLPWDNTTITGTTSNGQAQISFSAPTKVGDYELIIKAGEKEERAAFSVIPDLPNNIELKVELPSNAINGVVPADGTSAVILTAIVTDKYLNPSTGTINFTSLFSKLNNSSMSLVNGIAKVSLTSMQEGTDTITATLGSLSKSVNIVFGKTEQQFKLGEPTTIPGTADHLAFTINTDDKFWLVRGYGRGLYTTILNKDKSIFKQDIKTPGRFYYNGYSGYYIDADYYPTIMARGDGYVDYVWTRWYDYQFWLMSSYHNADGVFSHYTYVMGGDNRDAYLTKDLQNNTRIAWSLNEDQAYYTIKIMDGSLSYSYRYGGKNIYVAGEREAVSTGRNYDPSITFDLKGNKWIFYNHSKVPDSYLKYKKITPDYNTTEYSLELEGKQPSSISYKDSILVAYQKGSDIIIRTISADGKIGAATVVAQGSCPILAKDTSGQIWLAWIGTDKTVNYAPINF